MVQGGSGAWLHDVAVELRQATPVQHRPEVMGGVKAVVQQEPVDQPSGDVPRVVVRAGRVAPLVLQQIDRDDPPLAEEPGQGKIAERRAPVAEAQRRHRAVEHHALRDRLPVEKGPSLAPVPEIAGLLASHARYRDEREGEQVQPVPAEVDERAAHPVELGVVVAMVPDVVRGDDGGGGVTREQAQHVAKDGIPAAAGERRTVDVVVLDHAGGEGESAGDEKQQPVAQPARPLRAEEAGEEGEEEQRTPIGAVAQRDEALSSSGSRGHMPSPV